MPAPKSIDFDQFLLERANKAHETGEVPTITIGGKVYPLPRELPAIVALEAVLMQRGGEEANVPAEKLFEVGGALFGTDTFRAILTENSLGISDVGDLIVQAFRVYDESDTEAEDGTVPNA